jgi:hypothetical protein
LARLAKVAFGVETGQVLRLVVEDGIHGNLRLGVVERMAFNGLYRQRKTHLFEGYGL